MGCAVREAQAGHWSAGQPFCSDANICTTAQAGGTQDTPAGFLAPHRADWQASLLASKQASSSWVPSSVLPPPHTLSLSFSCCFTRQMLPIWLVEQKLISLRDQRQSNEVMSDLKLRAPLSSTFWAGRRPGRGRGFMINNSLISHQMRGRCRDLVAGSRGNQPFPGPLSAKLVSGESLRCSEHFPGNRGQALQLQIEVSGPQPHCRMMDQVSWGNGLTGHTLPLPVGWCV